VRFRRRSIATAAIAGTALALGAQVTRRAIGERLSARTERRLNPVARRGPYVLPGSVADLHERLTVVDLHADSLLWGRDLLRRVDRGHVDVPRLIEGGIAIQVFAVATKVPRHLNIDRNDDASDDIALVALAQGWPPATWRSLTARAIYQAGRLSTMAARSAGDLTLLRSATELDRFVARRAGDPTIVAALLAIEGAHALDGDIGNLGRLHAAGFRIVGIAHFFDHSFAGSAHGVRKGGLTGAGRELVAELERREMIVDLAHASGATIEDVLALARRPVIVSHTGVRGVADNPRNLSDEQLRGIAATGGVVGIGFWPTATGGEDVASIARSIVHAISVVGADHVAIGSDYDGAVPVPFDASGMGLLTDALLAAGLDQEAIALVMGGSAVRVLRSALPDR
jgi:microsomal dipeptidase-like Zn-dependent dipeptidase